MSPLELAYIAGLLDGEGVVTVHKRRTRAGRGIRHPQVSLIIPLVIITNTDRPLLEWVRDILGVGFVCRTARFKPHWAHVYHYRTSDRAARTVLQLLLPYLRLKRRHAELVLGVPTMTKGKFEPEVYARKLEILTAIRALNNRQRDKSSDG